jgi:MFS family permease
MLKMIRRLKIASLVDLYLLLIAFMIPWQAHNFIRRAITPFHLVNVFFLILFLYMFVSQGKPLRLPYKMAAVLYLMGSILGMFSSKMLSVNVYALALDTYLYLWFALMCVLLRSSRRVEYLMTAWAIAVVFVLSTEGLGLLGGEKRLEFSLRNPNRAASYFGLSLFFLLHPVLPRILKILMVVAVLMAISATGSVAGLLMLPIGGVVFAWAWSYVRAGRPLRPLHHLAWGIAMVVALMGVYANIHWLEMGSTSTVVGRFSPRGGPRVEEGTTDRMEIWKVGMQTFRQHPFGIGPDSFRLQVDVGVEEDTKGMHSDFVAALVERGVLGFLGLLVLLAAVARTVMKMLRLSAQNGDRAQGFWAAALASAFAAYVSYGVTHEMLHHETFWLLLALILSHLSIVRRERYAAVVRVVPQKTGWYHVSDSQRTVRGRVKHV